MEKVLIEFNEDIVNSLNKRGSKAISINSKINNVINVTPGNKELGFVGIPDQIELKVVENIISNNQIPVVAPLVFR